MKNKPLEVGVTGGIGSGKSLICKIFKVLGAPVYDADTRARWITNNHPEVRESLTEAFGYQTYLESGLNRDFVAKTVFSDPEKLQLLNSIVHPAVGQDYDTWVNDNSSAAYTIKEAALIFESGSYKRLDKVINVSAAESIRIERVLKRDPFRKPEEVAAIISKQMSDQERAEKSDYIVYNDESQLLIPQILQLDRLFKENTTL